MRIFLTGATGFIGSAIIPELLDAGHQVIGLTRSDEGAERLSAAGIEVHRGTLEEPESLRGGAAKADAVIHTAFDHNFSNFVANCEKDSRVIAALGEELAGSDRPIIITSGTGMGAGDHSAPATEDVYNPNHPNPRKASEIAGNLLLEKGINLAVMRLPQVHDTMRQGLISPLIEMARKNGVFAYIGDGSSRFAAAHVTDVARLYRLAIEKHERGARYHAVAEEGITARQIAETCAKGMNIPAVSITPDKAADYFGWMAGFAGMDMPASSALTREKFNWHPNGPTLIADLSAMKYS
jgi:nucleoside-diphosphate-sugar epimerase